MLVRKFIVFLTLAASLLYSLPAAAWQRTIPGFGGSQFFLSSTNQRGGFTMAPDPLDAANPKEVYRFSIQPGPCTGFDCQQQSVRSTIQQGEDARQPKEVWYGWDIYFPADFPRDGQQATGKQIFNEWKDRNCKLVGLTVIPNIGGKDLLWEMSGPTGKSKNKAGEECQGLARFPIGPMSKIVGRWHRFEFFARWSKGDDGRYVVYMDGKKLVDYTGATCTNCDQKNQHLFGNYLCCTENTETIKPSTVYYRFVSRAKKREDLQWQ